jgi:hypothetical protein
MKSSLGIVKFVFFNLSENIILKEEQRQINLMIQKIYQSDDSLEFQLPVDYVKLNLYDYRNIVKQPMDLGTVK